MAQVMEHLQSKCEALSSKPRTKQETEILLSVILYAQVSSPTLSFLPKSHPARFSSD
jgi:hypothetical protein